PDRLTAHGMRAGAEDRMDREQRTCGARAGLADLLPADRLHGRPPVPADDHADRPLSAGGAESEPIRARHRSCLTDQFAGFISDSVTHLWFVISISSVSISIM